MSNGALARENVTLISAPPYNSGSGFQKLRALPKAIWSTRAQAQAADVITTFQPDLVHAFAVHVHLSPSVLAAAKAADRPTVMTCNDYKHICPNYKLYHHGRLCDDCKGGRFRHAARNRCAKGSLALSMASMAEAYAHDWLQVYDSCVDHFTFSADFMAEVTGEFWADREFSWSKLLNPFDSTAQDAPEGDDGYGLFFGRLIDEKGVDVLIEAAAKVDGFPIKIVGTGPDTGRLRRRAAELGLDNVAFLGPLWDAALEPVLSRARFVVVPSLWHENLPYVINQSFAAGRPVIGANRGGIPELVADGERGLVYDAPDSDALAAAIRALANDSALARRMGRAAKTWSDATFRDEVFYDALMTAYRKAQGAHPRARR